MTSLVVENIQHLGILGLTWCKALENSQTKRDINSTEFFAPLYGSQTLQTFCWLQVFVLLPFGNQNAGFFQNSLWKVNTYRNHSAKEHNWAAFGRLLFSFHVLLFIYLKVFGFCTIPIGYWVLLRNTFQNKVFWYYFILHLTTHRGHMCLYSHPYIKHRHCVTYDPPKTNQGM